VRLVAYKADALNFIPRPFNILVLALFCIFLQESAFAQTGPPEITTPGTKDTVFVVRRDTVVIVQRDSVTILKEGSDQEEQISEAEYRRRQRTGGYDQDRRPQNDVVRRRIDLREQRRREYEEWYDAQPTVRAGNTIAYKLYPTALGQIDFPSIDFAVEKTFDGKFGLQGSFGFLTTPLSFWTNFRRDIGTPRYGLRGFSVGASGRYYVSHVKNRFPFYMELEADYSLAPLEMQFFIPNRNGTFEQFIEAPVNGQQFYLGFLTGWELRTPEGFLVDLATGLRVGTKSITSSNPQIQESINRRFWNIGNFNGGGNGRTPFVSIVTRIGIGYGHWIEPEAKEKTTPSKKKSKAKGKRSKNRRRR
jgi:hypothetical protein